jgi:hypothetical protein
MKRIPIGIQKGGEEEIIDGLGRKSKKIIVQSVKNGTATGGEKVLVKDGPVR